VLIAQQPSRTERQWPRRSQRTHTNSSHVAAICYRIKDDEIEFLLVQTRAGRWTFPKGRVEDDSTRAAAAAREAFEEAGVQGAVEADPFVTYLHSKSPHIRAAQAELTVDAHLCEVRTLVAPEESFRNPTWFSISKTKRRLHEGRRYRYGSELSEVVDQAVTHISRRRRSLY
jgi:8-oxo-dGTP pyrophosphatase MutT (NUDIX family)